MFRRLLRRLQPERLSMLPSRAAYALWAATYPPEAHNALMQAEQTAMLDLMPSLAGKTVLDLACGTGRYGLLAERAGAGRVIAVDDSADMLRANRLSGRVLASLEALPLVDDSIDVLICALALGHLAALEAALSEIGRVLRPDGAALISDLHPFVSLSGAQRTFRAAGSLYAVEHHTHLYADYLAAATAANLTIESAREPTLERSPTPVVIVYRLFKR